MMAEGTSEKPRLLEGSITQSTSNSEERVTSWAANDIGDTTFTAAFSSILKLPPEHGASVLLQHIPHESSLSSKESSKILRMFELVKAGIMTRSKSQGIYFCNGRIEMPEETFVHVLNYLDKRDLIDSVSHVSYKWFKASLSPHVLRWQRIGLDTYKHPMIYQDGVGCVGCRGFCMAESTVKTPDKLWKLLSRPQFAMLKRLVVPYVIKITPGMLPKIAELCPQLEELIGLRSTPDNNMYNSSVHNGFTPAENHLVIPSLFPKLSRVTIQIRNREDVIDLVNRMGDRLSEIFIEPHFDLEDPLLDSDIEIIVEKCPHLTKFGYSDNYHRINIDTRLDRARMTAEGIKTLINGCTQLRTLELVGTAPRQSPKKTFLYIATRAKNLRFLDVTCSYDEDPEDTYQNEFGVEDQTGMDSLIRNCFEERLSREDRLHTGEGYLFKYKLKPVN